MAPRLRSRIVIAENNSETQEGGTNSSSALLDGYVTEQEYARQRGVSRSLLNDNAGWAGCPL